MTDEEAFELDLFWGPALVDMCQGKPDAFCELLRGKEQIPAPVRQFLADMIDGTLPPPPKRRARDTQGAWERQAIRVAAIAHLKRQSKGMERAELARLRKAAIYNLTQRHGRTWDTVEKLFKQELRRLKNEAGTR